MTIHYYGQSCFRLVMKPQGRATEDVTVFFDPFDKTIGLRPPQGNADIIFVSHHHPDHNNVAALKGNPVVIDTPGEYAIKGINVVGIDTFHDEENGAKRGRNTVFILEAEDLRICHLGDLGCDLTPAQIEEINGVDILFIPIGGTYTINGKKAAEIARKIEPALIIPMHYKLTGIAIDTSDENEFCTEMGTCQKQPVNKLTIKKKDLEGKHEEVMLLGME